MPKPQVARIPDRATRISSVRRREKIIGDLAALKEQLEAVEQEEALRLGRMCLRSGLADFELPDHTLEAALKELAVSLNPASPGKPKSPNSAEAKGPSDAPQSPSGDGGSSGTAGAGGARFSDKPASDAAQ